MINKKLKVGNVPNLRFPSFEGEWETKKLGDLCKIYDGTHQTPNYVESGIPFYSVEHITSNNFDKTKYISEEVYEKEIKRVKIEGGDILMTRIGDIGTSKYIDWNVKASFYVSLALIKQSSHINSKYLNQFISTDFFQKELWHRTIHVAFPKKINLGEIDNCIVNYPSNSEQKKISDFLSLLDERILTQSKIIKELEILIQELRNQIFKRKRRFTDTDGRDFAGWKKVKIGDILKIGNGKDYKHLQSGDIPVFGTGGFMTLVNDYLYDGETVCIGRKGTIDKPMYHEGKLWTVDTLFYTHSFQSCIPKFIFHLFQTINWLEYNEASGVPSLSKTTIEKIGLQIPSIEEQERIASFLNKIDHKIQTEKAILEQLEMQKKYLLKQMFV
ncbi:restriction endonuclease subunit S [Elizabethkingia anophelis]|uniref:restriction endonuclease subunit S n=1 Tax=Elizabethkingia anophelis TaxID=1117645 RepID=UPI0021A8DE7F|nr:restriction endonuclease subunit S [Elizabethkingia anophelis]MCT3836183.1 restriction endonuclease subunit S [Elizabethkingia anophelis]MCT3839643.1 restriction endonuclease subunit S [Elizabethkingia anophelis]MCT3846987.1 restriction endonuclease subunit S [Elizabethkingia anophelis]MCT3889583.1 restriction endonuclease subunit S [Elizabethkingia anophelis]